MLTIFLLVEINFRHNDVTIIEQITSENASEIAPYGATQDRKVTFFHALWRCSGLKQGHRCMPYGDTRESAAANYAPYGDARGE